jgi:hypothetical protein
MEIPVVAGLVVVAGAVVVGATVVVTTAMKQTRTLKLQTSKQRWLRSTRDQRVRFSQKKSNAENCATTFLEFVSICVRARNKKNKYPLPSLFNLSK